MKAYTIRLAHNGKMVASKDKVMISEDIYKTIREDVEAEFDIDIGAYSVHSICTDKEKRIITIEITEEHMAEITGKRREARLGQLGI
jgi:hypothetical protein